MAELHGYTTVQSLATVCSTMFYRCRLSLLLGFVATFGNGFSLDPGLRDEPARPSRVSFAEKREDAQRREDAQKGSNSRATKQDQEADASAFRARAEQLEAANRALRAQAGADANASAADVNVHLKERLQQLKQVEKMLKEQHAAEQQVFSKRDQVFNDSAQILRDATKPVELPPFPELKGYAKEIADQVRGAPEAEGSEYAGLGSNIAAEIRLNRAAADENLAGAIREDSAVHPGTPSQAAATAVAPPAAEEAAALKARVEALEAENAQLKENQALREKIAALETENASLKSAAH